MKNEVTNLASYLAIARKKCMFFPAERPQFVEQDLHLLGQAQSLAVAEAEKHNGISVKLGVYLEKMDWYIPMFGKL